MTLRWQVVIFGAGLALAGAGRAAIAPVHDPAVIKQLAECRPVADASLRLACYDKAADTLAQAQAAGDIVVVDKAQVREVRRQAFGFHLPSLDLLPRTAHEEPLQQVDFILASAVRSAESKWVLTTVEGTRWVQTDSEDIDQPPHTASQLRVRSGALGGFFCKVDGQSAVRCARQQ